MKLLIPYYGKLRPADGRLIRLAEFLGVECLPMMLTAGTGYDRLARRSETADDGSCIVVNPDVVREWMGGANPSPDRISSLLSPFRRVLVHAVRPDPFHCALIATLTAGRFHAVEQVQCSGVAFRVASDVRDICGAFAGLSIGVADPGNDRVFRGGGEGSRKIITQGEDALFAATRLQDTEVFLLGSEDVADLDAEFGQDGLSEILSRFLPHAMALRHIFQHQCWRPAQSHACVIIDDPLLRANYGFLNFEYLLRLMEQHHFRTTIAFIPHNFRRSSPRIARVFREHQDHLSLCFHGNDHIGAEFAAADPLLLNRMVQTAEERMAAHSRVTGIPCERVMVFPQGKFSVEAMAALRSHNFDAAVNTVPNPYQQSVQLTLREVAQPAVLRYAGFPLFVRRSSIRMHDAEIAFRIFFGVPILIVEHHDIFENPQPLIHAVARINSIAPEIRWSSAGNAVRGSWLHRRDTSGNLHVKAYARSVQVENLSPSSERMLVEWTYPGDGSAIEAVYRNAVRCAGFEADDRGVRVSAVLSPAASEVFSIHYRAAGKVLAPIGFRSSARAFIRRRLSEIRDNYISKSPSLLAAARTLQRRVLH